MQLPRPTAPRDGVVANGAKCREREPGRQRTRLPCPGPSCKLPGGRPEARESAMALSPGVASRFGGWPARASASLCPALALALAPPPAGAQLDTVRRWLGLEHAQRPWTGDLDG